MERHLDTHREEIMHKCHKCKREFDTEGMLQEHVKNKHKTPGKGKDEGRRNCELCGYKAIGNELKKHMDLKHSAKPVNCFPCNECELETQHIDELVEHKKTVHEVLKYACDLCEHVDGLLEGLWRHKIDAHQTYVPDTPEATYHMQKMLLVSLSAQVEFMVQALTKLSANTAQMFSENKTQMDMLENNVEKMDMKVEDLGVAIATTHRFDSRIQNDSLAVLTKVSEKCVQIENLALNAGRKPSESANPNNVNMDNSDNAKTGVSAVLNKKPVEEKKTKHENPSPIEPFPCDLCGLVLANFNLLQQHVKEHTPVKFSCQYCESTEGNQESLQCHMIKAHNEIAILCNMAKRVDKLTDSFASSKRIWSLPCYLYPQNIHLCLYQTKLKMNPQDLF